MATVPRTTILVSLAAVVVALAALFTSGDGDARPGRDGTLRIDIEGHRFEPAAFTVPANEPVTLEFVNHNTFDHDVAIGRDPRRLEGQPVTYEEDLLAMADARSDPAGALVRPSPQVDTLTLDLPAESTVRLELTVPEHLAGTWQLGCFVGFGCEADLSPTAELTVEP